MSVIFWAIAVFWTGVSRPKGALQTKFGIRFFFQFLREFATEQDVERHSAEKTEAFRKGVLRRMQGPAGQFDSWRLCRAGISFVEE
jgi:hypothetical protein